MLHWQNLHNDLYQQTTPHTILHDFEDGNVLGLIWFWFWQKLPGSNNAASALRPSFPMALPHQLLSLNTPLFNWHRIASAISATPLRTLAQASSSLGLTFVNALRFISSINWHCLASQEAFLQIKKSDLLITLAWVEATNPREVFHGRSDTTTDYKKEFNQNGLMILIQPVTSDKAPLLSTALRSPCCNSLLITDIKIKLILLPLI